MSLARQPLLTGFTKSKTKEFGGSLLKGNPREARPISTKRAIHLVMRSSLAKRELSFLHPSRSKRIQSLVQRLANKSGVKIYRFANSGNHLHLVILPRSRQTYRTFIRAVTGLIARLTLGVERGRIVSNKSSKRFWDARPFTRILEWGREYRNVCLYVLQNTLEAIGFIPYQPRGVRSARGKSPPVL